MKENNYKNKIITISGEPVSGKGTTVKEMIKILKQKGYKDNKIHLQTTGNEFRRYFTSVIELLKNIGDDEKLRELAKREELKEFFSTKSNRLIIDKTLEEIYCRDIDLKNFTIQQANEAPEFNAIRGIIDNLIDSGMKEKGLKINKEFHPNDIWIIDSRLAFSNIPEAFSVRLTANKNVAGKRLFEDNSRGEEDNYISLDMAIKERENRRITENIRYIKKYGINLEDENNYDLIIDTSYSSISDIANTIIDCSENFYNDKKFAKKWASPKIFLPNQIERDTIGKSLSGNSLENFRQKIETKGYYLDSPIEVLEVDNVKYIYEGHHRNFAMASLGETLIPYEVIAKDDELVPNGNNTARKMVDNDMKYLWGHEEIIEKGQGREFSYSEIYPELVAKLIDEHNNDYR